MGATYQQQVSEGITAHVAVDDIDRVPANAELHGGTIRAGSTPGEGMTFCFTPPAA